MKVHLRDLLTPEVIAELNRQGFEIVRVGQVPWWMEQITSMRNPVYRIKNLED